MARGLFITLNLDSDCKPTLIRLPISGSSGWALHRPLGLGICLLANIPMDWGACHQLGHRRNLIIYPEAEGESIHSNPGIPIWSIHPPCWAKFCKRCRQGGFMNYHSCRPHLRGSWQSPRQVSRPSTVGNTANIIYLYR